MKILNTDYFDNPTGNVEDGVFMIKYEDGVDVHHDSRGSFAEAYKTGLLPGKFENLSWCKQINVSSSEQFVFRGFHAQTGAHAQGKMVECTLGRVIDVIIDFRPDSKTFGKYISVELTAQSHDKLWIPRGFLHGFFSSETPAVAVGKLVNGAHQFRNALNQFMYMCDNEYNKDSEVSINPYSFFARATPSMSDSGLAKIKTLAASGKLSISTKDGEGMDFSQAMAVISEDYQKYGKCWYKSLEANNNKELFADEPNMKNPYDKADEVDSDKAKSSKPKKTKTDKTSKTKTTSKRANLAKFKYIKG